MHTTTRQDRTFVTWLLQTIIRPLKPKLVESSFTPPKQISVQCTPSKKIKPRCNVSERIVEGLYVYDIEPKHRGRHDKTQPKQRVYYFAGGGWKMPPSSQHWSICSSLAHDLTNTIVSLVSYPLAPTYPSTAAYPVLYKFYETCMRAAVDADERVILAGDSSGGNVALCLSIHAARDHQPPLQCPAAAILMCPTTDLTPLENKGDMIHVSKEDPILTLDIHNSMARAWVGDQDSKAPHISPLYADLNRLAASSTHLFVITAGSDILTPDALKFRDRCVTAGVKGHWLNWEKQMHVFPLTWEYFLPEARKAMTWIVECVKELPHIESKSSSSDLAAIKPAA